jgi:pimeloyl-ACP methyl ester carboxylesterase
MKGTIFIFVNGILNMPSDVNGWTDKAEAWIEVNTVHKATRLEYFSDVLFRRLHQESLVDDLGTICERYDDHKIILVGHSNGCDVIVRLIKRMKHDIKNGINAALQETTLGKVTVYWSPRDKALKEAKWSTKLFGWLGLGYGYLGLTGPYNVAKNISHKVSSVERDFDHSQWFTAKNFDETMLGIAAS